ncbi:MULTISPECIES: 50S ribosomal protein L11 methyltransferase [Peptoniphilus]|uniref:50S ribosomal protein L11 methyltransferase n=1 Tax=Peptoniphilus TaxID=162289 RepID=UPI00030A5B18|nr:MULTISPECIES: 50S ribosomal protein L11 methyltransferase [Peptoniphilus]
MKYIELIINTIDNNREFVLNELYNRDIYVFEEDSIEIIEELAQNEKSWDFVDEDVFSIGKGNLILKCYFSIEEKERAEEIKFAIENKKLGSADINITDDEDWANNWKKYYHPIEIGEKILIKPTWEEYENKDRIVIDIDPGMAFGTGTHETTYMCIEALEEYVKQDNIVFDIGCGSGILGIAAIKLGAEKVIAVDIDQKCIEASLENANMNNVSEKIKVYKGNLLDVVSGNADIIVSNIIAEIIVDMIGDLKRHLTSNGIFISSGIIVEKIDMVKNALIKEGFEIIEIRENNGWSLIVGRVIKNV